MVRQSCASPSTIALVMAFLGVQAILLPLLSLSPFRTSSRVLLHTPQAHTDSNTDFHPTERSLLQGPADVILAPNTTYQDQHPKVGGNAREESAQSLSPPEIRNAKDRIEESEKAHSSPAPQTPAKQLRGRIREASRKEDLAGAPIRPILPIREASNTSTDSCAGRRLFIYTDLPSVYNQITANCSAFCPERKDRLCSNLHDDGLGHRFTSGDVVIDKYSGSSYSFEPWRTTEQHMLGILFNKRARTYDCITRDWKQANVFYIPAPVGLMEICRLDAVAVAFMDSAADQLEEYLGNQPGFKRHRGKHHFVVDGQQQWSLARASADPSQGWGAYVLARPKFRNITFISVESIPKWKTFASTRSMPYPTAFHPANKAELEEWVAHVRHHPRKILISLACGKRNVESVRNEVMENCKKQSDVCSWVDCRVECPENFCFRTNTGEGAFCSDPRQTATVYLSSTFCLQPPGDSKTRRSVFDALIAGCIPVFFDKDSFSSQYPWNVPVDKSQVSLFFRPEDVLSGKIDFIKEIQKVPEKQIRRMRERILELIPQLVIRDHTAHHPGTSPPFRDALDVGLEGIIRKVTTAP